MANNRHKLLAAGTVALIAEPVAMLAHTGGLGVIVGLAAGAVAYAAVDEIEEATGREFSLPVGKQSERTSQPGKHSLAYRMIHGKSTRPQEIDEDEDDQDDGPDTDELGEESDWSEGNRKPAWLVLSPDVILRPDDLIAKAIAIVAQRRSGKTTLAARIAEQIGDQYVPLFIPNSEGDYSSLYERLPRAVIAAAPGVYHQDEVNLWEVTPEYADVLGFNILYEGLQVIFEMDSFADPNEAWQVVIGVIQGMYQFASQYPESRCPVHVFLDEAQKYLPQDLTTSAITDEQIRNALLKEYANMLSSGGKRGITPVIVTQRLAETNNKIMAQAEVRFIMRQTHDTDLDRAMKYVQKTTATKQQIASFNKGQGIFIAEDGSQVITTFYPRESDGGRSQTPQAEDAARFMDRPLTMNAMQRELPNTPNPTHYDARREQQHEQPPLRQPRRRIDQDVERAVQAYLHLRAAGKRASQPAIANKTGMDLWKIRKVWAAILDEVERLDAAHAEEAEPEEQA